ncbi:MAG TPA: hypothetical protein VN253_05165 [Kofleriaceae bacterium]|nr:hypothetical protein [Kofleriaceae bacterium]
MKLFYALLLAAAFTATACAKKKDDGKTDPAAKTAEPAAADPAKADPAKADPAKADPAKADPAKADPAKADTAKPGSAYTVDEAGAMALALADKIVKAIEDGGEDCAKMGGNLKAHIDEAKAAAALDKDFNKDAAKKAEFKKKFDPQLEAKMTGSMPKLQKCATNADVKAFIDSVAAE